MRSARVTVSGSGDTSSSRRSVRTQNSNCCSASARRPARARHSISSRCADSSSVSISTSRAAVPLASSNAPVAICEAASRRRVRAMTPAIRARCGRNHSSKACEIAGMSCRRAPRQHEAALNSASGSPARESASNASASTSMLVPSIQTLSALVLMTSRAGVRRRTTSNCRRLCLACSSPLWVQSRSATSSRDTRRSGCIARNASSACPLRGRSMTSRPATRSAKGPSKVIVGIPAVLMECRATSVRYRANRDGAGSASSFLRSRQASGRILTTDCRLVDASLG